jgi:hypothetical protein
MRTLTTLPILLAAGIALASPAPTSHIKHVPADFPTIQSAIDAAVSGDAIVLAAETYNEAISIVGKSHLEIRGSAAAKLDASGNDTAIDLSNSDHIRVHGFRIANANIQLVRINACAVVTVDHCDLTGDNSVMDGIVVSASDQTTIQNNDLDGSSNIGIRLVPSTSVVNSIIRKNTLLGPFGGGILVSGGHNVIDSNKIGEPGVTGIAVDLDSTDTTLRHNFILEPIGTGIDVFGPNCFVDRNTVELSTGQGIRIEAAALTCKLSKNFINEPVGIGIEVDADGCVSSGNRVRNAAGLAIRVVGFNGTFTSEHVDHCGADALEVDGNGNIITNCHFNSPGDDGYDIDGSANILTNCSATHAHHRGFAMDGSANILTTCKASACATFDLFDDNGDRTTNIYSGCTFPNANIPFNGQD